MAKRYSPKLKFQIVLEVLKGEQSVAQLAKAYRVLPNSIHKWKGEFLENGPEVFNQEGIVADYEQRLADLKQLLGNKEVEIALK